MMLSQVNPALSANSMRDIRKKDYWHTTEAATDRTPLFLSNLVSTSLTLDTGGKDARVAHRGPATDSNWQHVQQPQTPVY